MNISFMSLGMVIPWKIIAYLNPKTTDLKKRIERGSKVAFWMALTVVLIYEGTIRDMPVWPKFFILGICVGFLFVPLLFPDIKNAKQIMQIFRYALSTKEPINIPEINRQIQKDLTQEIRRL